jgi:hypothetical protein
VNDLDDILSGRGEAAPEQTNTEQQVTQAAQEPAGESQQEPAATEAAPDGEQQQGQKMVPHEALHAEKQKVKRYTEEVAEFRRTNEALQRQIAELLQRVPVPQQEQRQVPDIFENPQGAVHHMVAPQFDQINQHLLAIAKDNAIVRYTEDKVNEAETAFIQALQSRSLDPADYQRVVSSPNRYAAAVQWHQRQLAQQEIGDDPAAFKEKVRAEIEAEILSKHGLSKGAAAQTAAAVMPSNLAGARNVGTRAGPAWSGPPNLQDIFKR